MKKLFILFLLFGAACSESTDILEKSDPAPTKNNEIVQSEFQAILDAAGVKGSILIFDEHNYYSNDFDWAKVGRLPASTYKIPNSIIALELGIMQDDRTVFPWDGKPRAQERWEQDLSLKEAFHASCVPCYQEIARKVGVNRMKQFTSDFHYGKMDIDSSNIDMFWLEGKSTISQFQQISFLQTFNEQGLPISPRTYKLMLEMMIIEQDEGSVLRGKSGWSFQNNIDNCWFVGYAETLNGTYYFATNFEFGANTKEDDVPTIRKQVTIDALNVLGYLNEK